MSSSVPTLPSAPSTAGVEPGRDNRRASGRARRSTSQRPLSSQSSASRGAADPPSAMTGLLQQARSLFRDYMAAGVALAESASTASATTSRALLALRSNEPLAGAPAGELLAVATVMVRAALAMSKDIGNGPRQVLGNKLLAKALKLRGCVAVAFQQLDTAARDFEQCGELCATLLGDSHVAVADLVSLSRSCLRARRGREGAINTLPLWQACLLLLFRRLAAIVRAPVSAPTRTRVFAVSIRARSLSTLPGSGRSNGSTRKLASRLTEPLRFCVAPTDLTARWSVT